MDAALQPFCETRLPFPGLAAWAARHPDRTMTNQCFANWLTPARVEQSLTRLALAAESLHHQRLDPVRLCWVFEHIRLHLAIRPDGACLALFVENRPGLPPATPEGVLDDFLRL